VGEFPPSPLTALAPVGVEAGLALDDQVASAQRDRFGSASAGQDNGQQDGSVAPSGDGVRYNGQEPPYLVGAESTGH
jgi:hypothetical protein